MKNMDFEIFKKECSWFIEPTDKIEIKETDVSYSEDFKKTYPLLFGLLLKARTVEIILTRTRKKKETVVNYRLYSWDTKDGNTAGWLCKIESGQSAIPILPEHELLINHIGGIQESYETDSENEKLTDNQNFLFIKSDCELSAKEWNEYYLDSCEEEGLEPLDTDHFLAFALEANGNTTYYDLRTKQVFLFAPDHCFDYVTEVENQPEYTFYRINGVDTFVDYVEKLAKQWLNEII